MALFKHGPFFQYELKYAICQVSSIRSAGLPTSSGFRYFSTAGLIRSARCVNVAQP